MIWACSSGKFLKDKSLRNALSCNLEKKSSCNDAYLIYHNKKEWYSGRICLFHCCFRSLFLSYSYKLKAHFQPWCNARRDPISCNTKFPDHWKPSKIVFLKSHPEHIVNSFTVNTFAVRHFTVSLQYFEFCPEESEEKVSRLGLLVLCEESAKRTIFKFFSLSRRVWGF